MCLNKLNLLHFTCTQISTVNSRKFNFQNFDECFSASEALSTHGTPRESSLLRLQEEAGDVGEQQSRDLHMS